MEAGLVVKEGSRRQHGTEESILGRLVLMGDGEVLGVSYADFGGAFGVQH